MGGSGSKSSKGKTIYARPPGQYQSQPAEPAKPRDETPRVELSPPPVNKNVTVEHSIPPAVEEPVKPPHVQIVHEDKPRVVSATAPVYSQSPQVPIIHEDRPPVTPVVTAPAESVSSPNPPTMIPPAAHASQTGPQAVSPVASAPKEDASPTSSMRSTDHHSSTNSFVLKPHNPDESILKEEAEIMKELNAAIHKDMSARRSMFLHLCKEWHPDKNKACDGDRSTRVFQFIQHQKSWFLAKHEPHHRVN